MTPEHVLRRDAARRRGPLGVCPVCDLPESVMFVDPHPDAPDALCLRCSEPFALVPIALLVEGADR